VEYGKTDEPNHYLNAFSHSFSLLNHYHKHKLTKAQNCLVMMVMIVMVVDGG